MLLGRFMDSVLVFLKYIHNVLLLNLAAPACLPHETGFYRTMAHMSLIVTCFDRAPCTVTFISCLGIKLILAICSKSTLSSLLSNIKNYLKHAAMYSKSLGWHCYWNLWRVSLKTSNNSFLQGWSVTDTTEVRVPTPLRESLIWVLTILFGWLNHL